MNGIESIAAERQRQIDIEGWASEHDDSHQNGEMAASAACYAMSDLQIDQDDLRFRVTALIRDLYPWASTWWKPKSKRANLVRAGALIAAEIDRLDRAEKLAT